MKLSLHLFVILALGGLVWADEATTRPTKPGRLTTRPAELGIARTNGVYLSWLRSNEDGKVRDASRRLSDNRLDLVKGLIQIAKTAHGKEVTKRGRLEAIFLLGEMRAPEAVPALLEILNGDLGLDVVIWDMDVRAAEPAVALMKIGGPAKKELLNVLATSNDEVFRNGVLNILLVIDEGKSGAIQTVT